MARSTRKKKKVNKVAKKEETERTISFEFLTNANSSWISLVMVSEHSIPPSVFSQVLDFYKQKVAEQEQAAKQKANL